MSISIEPDSAIPAGMKFVHDSRLNNTSGWFLYSLARDPERLRVLLSLSSSETPSDGDLTEVRGWLWRRYRVAWVHKFLINMEMFWLSVLVLFVGTFWQIINLFAWDRLGHPEWRVVQPWQNSLIESALIIGIAGGILFIYQWSKRRQSAIEDVMRMTLFAHESLAQKRRRFEHWSRKTATAPNEKKNRTYEQVYKSALEPEYLAKRLKECTGGLVQEVRVGGSGDANVLFALLAQMQDARIKAYSYNNLAKTFRVVGWFCTAVGFTWSFLNPWTLELSDPVAIGTIQSVMMVGGGGLAFNLGKQYKRRRDQVADVMDQTLNRIETLVAKTARLIEVLRSVDTGLEKE